MACRSPTTSSNWKFYSARSATDRTRVKAALDAHNAWCPMSDGVYRRSRIVQEQLTAKVDLLVAAAAEEAGLTLLHQGRDFDTIARTTGQPVRTIDLSLADQRPESAHQMRCFRRSQGGWRGGRDVDP
ncbi:hypothetical protein [Streptomyces sp. NPDC056660]|uniref:hypothetical protein n=1 Tax=Streptomyces sp. NPDC056660 TaxID=3345897 RepID=UPI0036B7B202